MKKWGGLTEHGRKVIAEMNRLGIMIDISHATDEGKLEIIEASKAPVVGSHHGLRHFVEYPRNFSDEVLRAVAAEGGLMGMHSNASFLSKEYVEWRRRQSSSGGSTALHEIEGYAFSRPAYGDFGEYIRSLDAEMRDRWLRDQPDRGGTGYGIPWRERHKRAVDAGAPLPTISDWADQVDYVVEMVGDDHLGIGLDLMSGPNLRDFDATGYPRLTEALVEKGYSEQRIKKILGENWLRLLDEAKVP